MDDMQRAMLEQMRELVLLGWSAGMNSKELGNLLNSSGFYHADPNPQEEQNTVLTILNTVEMDFIMFKQRHPLDLNSF